MKLQERKKGEEDHHHLQAAGCVEQCVKFFFCPTIRFNQIPMLHINYFLHNANSPLILGFNFMVLNVTYNTWIKLVNMEFVCQEQNVSEVLASHSSSIQPGQAVQMPEDLLGLELLGALKLLQNKSKYN